MVQLANQYVDKTAPWNLAKKQKDAQYFHPVLYHMAETLRILGLSLCPFMPYTVDDLLAQLGHPYPTTLSQWDLKWGQLQPGNQIHKGRALFPRIE